MTTADLDLPPRPGRRDLPAETLAALTRAVASAAGRDALDDALHDIAAAARVATESEAAVVRVLDAGRASLDALAVAAPATLAAELQGGRLPLDELPDGTVDDLATAPLAVRHAAGRAAATQVLLVPVRVDGAAASLELLRPGLPFSEEQRLAAELSAAQLALVLRAFSGSADAVVGLARPALELAGEALAAALDEAHASAEIVRVAANVAGATAAILWEVSDEGRLELAASHAVAPDAELGAAREAAERTLAEPGPVRALPAERLPSDCGVSTTLPLGRPAGGVLQLLHPAAHAPTAVQLERLATFAVRAAHALRASTRARQLALELERTRALLTVIGQATAELSVAHTLQTAVDRIAELLGVERVAIYLRSGGDDGLEAAAARGVEGPHARLAERLLDLALGPARGRAVVALDDVTRDRRLADAAPAARESGIRGAIAVPLLGRDEVIGLLAVYADRRRVGDHETALLAALAGQLAVAVQNAQLHERATRLGEEREQALRSEREAARRLRALYEVSRSFASTMSLDDTLQALARTIVEVLDVDAAVIRMPDERREQLVPQAIEIKDGQLREVMTSLLFRPSPFGALSQQLWRTGRPIRVEAGSVDFLSSFLDKGWTAALVPVAKGGEVMAALTIWSFRPGAPLSDATIDDALALVGQASLAIDNARLYLQQKQFADTMQRSLLPRSRPEVEGLEVGEVYESSARVELGGDVYDFLALDDGRLAVVLGDVTGHGVDATADMAMAKFVFRSLAREHTEPGDFLASANDVICGEIAPAKFITMTYVVVDGARGQVACANAGHPAPRLVLPDGEVRPLDANGIVLGIDPRQEYEETRVPFPPGAALVLYTDGVIEARRDGELYGADRLDLLLSERQGTTARTLAAAVAEDARAFAHGELSDDLAVVVIRRTA
ncbi:MAG: SpoIIE family protein phosphatase [Actinobacteria bacterium]|nr:SpoIIE family protein phosphatase [Actinomycetota bacterium]